MGRAPFTYELPPAAASHEGLEGFLVYASDDPAHPVGKVGVLLDLHGERLLAVERDRVLERERRVVPWDAVAAVDPTALTVLLRLTKAELEAADELDPELGRETGPAEARRLTEIPEIVGRASPEVHRAPGSRWAAWATAFGTLFGVSLLAALASYEASRRSWVLWLLAIPVAFLVATAVSLYNLRRQPYEPLGPATG